MGLQIFDERTVLTAVKLMLPADGTAAVSILPVHSSDRRVDSIIVSNRDTIAHVCNLTLVAGAVTVELGSVSVAASAGYLGTPGVDILASCLPATVVGLAMPPAGSLNLSLSVALVATFDLSVTVNGGVF